MKLLHLLPLALLTACSQMPDITGAITPYRIDVRQGNFVTQEIVTQLKPGMTKDQVRFILGTPLVMDIFHADRWDYIYRFAPGRGEAQQWRLTVFFEGGKLARIAGDVVANEEVSPEAAGLSRGRVIDIVPEAADKKNEAGAGQQDSRPAGF